jgi:hypothetical protein
MQLKYLSFSRGYYRRKEKFYIIYEYFNKGSLDDHLKELRNQNTTRQLAQRKESLLDIFFQLCLGVFTLNKLKMIHNDLKPDNIMVHQEEDKQNRYVIIDYGFTQQVEEKSTILRSGSPLFSSPEKFSEEVMTNTNLFHNVKNLYKVDVWSLGLIFNKILTGNVFFDFNFDKNEQYQNHNEIIYNIMYKEYYLNEAKQWGKDLEGLILKMLRKNPIERISITEILQDRVFEKQRLKFKGQFEKIKNIIFTSNKMLDNLSMGVLMFKLRQKEMNENNFYRFSFILFNYRKMLKIESFQYLKKYVRDHLKKEYLRMKQKKGQIKVAKKIQEYDSEELILYFLKIQTNESVLRRIKEKSVGEKFLIVNLLRRYIQQLSHFKKYLSELMILIKFDEFKIKDKKREVLDVLLERCNFTILQQIEKFKKLKSKNKFRHCELGADIVKELEMGLIKFKIDIGLDMRLKRSNKKYIKQINQLIKIIRDDKYLELVKDLIKKRENN